VFSSTFFRLRNLKKKLCIVQRVAAFSFSLFSNFFIWLRHRLLIMSCLVLSIIQNEHAWVLLLGPLGVFTSLSSSLSFFPLLPLFLRVWKGFPGWRYPLFTRTQGISGCLASTVLYLTSDQQRAGVLGEEVCCI